MPKGLRVRRLHKAFLRYHDPNNWPVLREALRRMGRAELIGRGRHQLFPALSAAGHRPATRGRRSVVPAPAPSGAQRTGLPSRGRSHSHAAARGAPSAKRVAARPPADHGP